MSRRQSETKNSSIQEKRVPPIWHFAIIIAAGMIAFEPSFHGVFLLDDGVYITANPDIKALWPLWQHLANPDRGLVQLTLAVNYALGGLNPFSYHVFNLAVHLLAALTLYGLARRTLEICGNIPKAPAKPAGGVRPPTSESRYGIALAVALLWVIHPLATQAVTYVIQRGESMMALFYLLTLYGLARGATAKRPWPWYAASVVACAAGMKCKEVMITAPVVALIYDRAFLADSWRALAKKRWPLYAGLAATAALLQGGGALALIAGRKSVGAAAIGFGLQDVTPWEYLRSQPAILLHYLRLTLWPHPLCFDYDWPIAAMSANTVAAGLAVIVLLSASVWALNRKPAVGFPGAAFFLILAPTSSFVPIKDLAVEHRMYLPLAAVIAMLVVIADRLLTRATKTARRTLLGAAVATLGVLTFLRNSDYTSAVTLWSDVVAQRPANARAWSHLGNAQSDARQFDAAIASYRSALRCKPNWAEIENNLGEALAKSNRLEEAVAAFKSAVAHAPILSHVHLNLALALHQLGRLDEAIEHYQIGLAASPEQVDPRNNLGIALRDRGRVAEAEQAHRTALQYAPAHAPTHYALAFVLEKEGKIPEAIREYQTTLQLDPANSGARTRLQSLQTKTGRP